MVMSNGAGAPVPVRFGGAGSVSSERDCIIVGEFTPEYNKIKVRLKGLGPNANTGIDNRVYEREAGSQDKSIIGVVGRGEWAELLATQPEAALALRRGMADGDDGDNYAYEVCICESGEVRGKRQHEPVQENVDTLRNTNLVPETLYDYIADFLGVGEGLTSEQEFTFTFEKLVTGSVRTPTDGVSPFTADEDERYLMVTVDFDWAGANPGARTMSLVFDTNSGNGINKNAYVFIGNPMCFWPHSEVEGAIAGVQVLSVEYLRGAEPVITDLQLDNSEPLVSYWVPVVRWEVPDPSKITGYMFTIGDGITPPTEGPALDDAAWRPAAPNYAEVRLADQRGTGDYVFYPWVKDIYGNISTLANALDRSLNLQITIA